MSVNSQNASTSTEKGFNWDIPVFEDFANACVPVPSYTREGYPVLVGTMSDKYPSLRQITISSTKFPLYALNARVLERSYGVCHPKDRRQLVVRILKRLFDPKLFTGDNHDNIEHIFWVVKERRLSKDWGLSFAELEQEIENIEDFKLLYFFKITDINTISPFMHRSIMAAMDSEDPREKLQSNFLNSNAIVGVLAGLILAAVLPLATSIDMGIFGSRMSQVAIITSSICTCFTFLIIVYSADNVIRLTECPTDHILEFLCAAFDRRTITDPKFWTAGRRAFSFLLNLMCDYLYLLMFAVFLVGTALWHWVGMYTQKYAMDKYKPYVFSMNQNVTEMELFYQIRMTGAEFQRNINGQFLAICISVMVLLGLLVLRCVWLKVLLDVVADINEESPLSRLKGLRLRKTQTTLNAQAKKKEEEERKKQEMEAGFSKKVNFGLDERNDHSRQVALKKLIVVDIILLGIYIGVWIWALWDSVFWVKDGWKKCCAATSSFTLSPTF